MRSSTRPRGHRFLTFACRFIQPSPRWFIHMRAACQGKRFSPGGPVGIFGVLAVQFSTDYRLALSFLVMLNINLAILNMFPMPVLDGGHILMAVIERIRRRPLEVRIVEYTTTGFAILLISFMIYVTFFDVKRLPLFHLMFNRDSQVEQPATPSDVGTKRRGVGHSTRQKPRLAVGTTTPSPRPNSSAP